MVEERRKDCAECYRVGLVEKDVAVLNNRIEEFCGKFSGVDEKLEKIVRLDIAFAELGKKVEQIDTNQRELCKYLKDIKEELKLLNRGVVSISLLSPEDKEVLEFSRKMKKITEGVLFKVFVWAGVLVLTAAGFAFFNLYILRFLK